LIAGWHMGRPPSVTSAMDDPGRPTGRFIRARILTCCVNNAPRYYGPALRSFRDKETEAVWHRRRPRKLDPPLQRAAWQKLAMLDAAETLADPRVPPGNRLERLAGDRAGQYRIRINQ
jgi:toxin HigB-1